MIPLWGSWIGPLGDATGDALETWRGMQGKRGRAFDYPIRVRASIALTLVRVSMETLHF